MDHDFEIEIQGEENSSRSQVQLPTNFLLFGELETDDVRIYIKQDIYKALEKYSAADTEHERGTILLGDYVEDFGRMHVVISDYIEAKNTDASASTLTFTHETWDYVYKEQEKNHGDKKIIGWQHTHPNYGIFLSNYDMFIQENFFNLPFQIAYVIDPIQSIRGFFQWKNGKVEKLHGYYIYDDPAKPIKIEQSKPSKQDHPAAGISRKLGIILLAMVLLLVVTMTVGFYLLAGQIRDQKATIHLLSADLETGREAPEAGGEIYDILDQQEKKIQDHDRMLLEIEEERNESQTDDTEEKTDEKQKDEEQKYIKYVVKRGDTLYSICKANHLDYFCTAYQICKENHIQDPAVIYTGQQIWLPVSP